jgi:hypothetical protein
LSPFDGDAVVHLHCRPDTQHTDFCYWSTVLASALSPFAYSERYGWPGGGQVFLEVQPDPELVMQPTGWQWGEVKRGMVIWRPA